MDIDFIKSHLPLLLPKAIAWAEETESYVIKHGKALNQQQISDAHLVGVKHPEKIYTLELASFPLPDDALLQQVATALSFLGENTAGLTLGHAILIKQGAFSRRLLSHECRHVYQYEQLGSIAHFFEKYFLSVLSEGYFDSIYEKDARQHELPNNRD